MPVSSRFGNVKLRSCYYKRLIVGGSIVGGSIVGGSIVGGSIVGGSIVGGSIVGGSIVGGSIVAHPFEYRCRAVRNCNSDENPTKRLISVVVGPN